MKITLTVGETDTVLADHGKGGTSDFRLSPTFSSQINNYIGASFGAAESMDNFLNVISFSVSEEHDTITEAEIDILTKSQSLSRTGTVTFQADDRSTTKQAEAALVEITELSYAGVSVKTTYQIKCGEIIDVPE